MYIVTFSSNNTEIVRTVVQGPLRLANISLNSSQTIINLSVVSSLGPLRTTYRITNDETDLSLVSSKYFTYSTSLQQLQ